MARGGSSCFILRSQILHKIISTHLLIMEVDFCPVLCIPEVPVLQAFRGISHFVWYCKAVSHLSKITKISRQKMMRNGEC